MMVQAMLAPSIAAVSFCAPAAISASVIDAHLNNGSHLPTVSISCTISRPISQPRASAFGNSSNNVLSHAAAWGSANQTTAGPASGLYRTATLKITRTASGMATLEGFVDGSRTRGLDFGGGLEIGSGLSSLARALERRSSMGSGDLSRLLSGSGSGASRSSGHSGPKRLVTQASLGAVAGAALHSTLAARRRTATAQRISQQRTVPEDAVVEQSRRGRKSRRGPAEDTMHRDADVYSAAASELLWDPLDLNPGVAGPSGLYAQLQMPKPSKGIPEHLQDWYQGLMKKDWPSFFGSVAAAPVLMSLAFTGLYMLDPSGLAMDDSLRESAAAGFQIGDLLLGKTTPTPVTDVLPAGNPFSAFQAFMYSLSIATGLDPTLHPVSPFAMAMSNINAMASQMMFVFLSGAVFSRLSQPSKPVQCASNIVFSPPQPSELAICRDPWAPEHVIKQSLDSAPMQPGMLVTRYALADPNSELVDVKVDLTLTRTVRGPSGWMRCEEPLELVKSGAAYQRGGMMVRHIVNEDSPLKDLTEDDLLEEDAIFTLSVVGLDRTTMQSVFHIEHYPANAGRVTCSSMAQSSKASRPVRAQQFGQPAYY